MTPAEQKQIGIISTYEVQTSSEENFHVKI